MHYIPRPWHQLGPFTLLLIGLYVGNNYETNYNTVIFCIAIYLMAIRVEWYIARCGEMHQAYMTNMRDSVTWDNKVQEAAKPKVSLFNNGRFVKQMQLVEAPKLNKERDLAIALIRMSELDPKQVNLTESRWVRAGKFVRGEFLDIIYKWSYHGVIARKAERKNSPYYVANWNAVKLIARGENVPPPPHPRPM